MWISRLEHFQTSITYQHLRDELDRLVTLATRLQAELAAATAFRNVVEQENRDLRERLIAAEGAARGLQAIADSAMLAQNKLQRERDEFLAKILDPSFKPTIVTPQIVRDPVVHAPGVDFEDIGDDNARREGYDVPIKGEELTGLLGRVYDPAADAAGSPSDVGFQPPPDGPGFNS